MVAAMAIGSTALIAAVAALGLAAAAAPTPGTAVVPTGSFGGTESTLPTEGLLTFAEECNGPAVDARWTPLYVVGDPGHGLDSDFLGDLSRVTVANGMCRITAQRTRTPSGRPYASAAMGTRTTFSQAYGEFEARIRYPSAQGAWPAFWMLQDGQRSGPPEIDILEAYPGRGALGTVSGPNVIFSALHSSNGTHSFAFEGSSDLTAEFHVYRLSWSPGTLVFSVDGIETGRIASDVPAEPMYPIFNLAMGASGFRVDGSTPAIAVMDIDYLRVWQAPSGT